MIKIENVEVFGWEAAIRGMRNPMNSWDKSDSGYCCGDKKCSVIEDCDLCCDIPHFEIRNNDLKLMKNLINAGSDHGKVARFVNVTVDITAPFYWWKEFKTYRMGRQFLDDGDEFIDPEEFEMFIETNSCSTMHKIHSKEFTLDDFSHEHLMNYESVAWGDIVPTALLNTIVATLNKCRSEYLRTKDKKWWWQIIQLLPSSYNQKRTVQLNYMVLRRMYHARKNHKLDEWIALCDWIKTLPYAKELIIGEDKNNA